jgi:tetratricopeptide (TPR) repeat protein
LARDIGNYRAALEYSKASHSPLLADLAIRLSPLWYEALGPSEGRAWLEAALSGPLEDKQTRLHATDHLAGVLSSSGDLTAARSYRLEALILSEEVAEDTGDHRALAGTLIGLAQLESDAGDINAARAYAERALETCRSLVHPAFLIGALAMAGAGLLRFREIDRAQELLEGALIVARGIEDTSERESALSGIRVVQIALAECRGEWHAALRLQREELNRYPSEGLFMLQQLAGIAAILIVTGRPARGPDGGRDR